MIVVSSLAVRSQDFRDEELEHEVPCHREATPANRSSLLSARCDRLVKNRVSFWSITPNNLVFLPVDSAMASAHNGIFRVACDAEYPDLEQLLLSQERIIWLFL